MPNHAGFAAALTVREHVLRSAVQASYANGSDSGKKFVEDLSGGGIGMLPDILLGQLDIDRRGIEARQFIFNCAQCLEHLAGQKELCAPLRLGNRQHSPLPPTPAKTLAEAAAFLSRCRR